MLVVDVGKGRYFFIKEAVNSATFRLSDSVMEGSVFVAWVNASVNVYATGFLSYFLNNADNKQYPV